jgi:hypothetical protein
VANTKDILSYNSKAGSPFGNLTDCDYQQKRKIVCSSNPTFVAKCFKKNSYLSVYQMEQ